MSENSKSKKKTVRVTLKRHEKNKDDELIKEGFKDALKYGRDYIRVGPGKYALNVKGRIYVFHSPKNRAKQTAEQLYRGIVMEEGNTHIAYSPLEESLLDAQKMPESYRKKIAPLTKKEVWKSKGLPYVIKNDPGKEGGEPNDNVAARVAEYIMSAEKYLDETKEGSETQVIAVCHGPMPEHFLLNAYIDGNYHDMPAEQVIKKIGGGFGNGDTFEVIITEQDGKRTYEIKRPGISSKEVSKDKLESIINKTKHSAHHHGDSLPSVGYGVAA